MAIKSIDKFVNPKKIFVDKPKKIGFIGLGRMGGAMAGHLAVAGHNVHVFNRSKKKIYDWLNVFSNYSVNESDSLQKMGRDCEIIISCVGNDEDLKEVTFQKNGCFKSMSRGTFFIDHSTVSFSTVIEINKFAREKNISFFDAPVSGGTVGAKNGHLSVMFGSAMEQVPAFKSIVAPYSETIERVGSVGTGQLAKMVNQICISGLLQGLAEALKFGLDSGLEMNTVLSVISKGAAQSWQMDNRASTMLKGEYDFGFAVDHMVKDLEIVLKQGRLQSSDLNITKQIKKFYEELSFNGYGDLDTSSLFLRLNLKTKNKKL